jgi:hypothetical protein
MSSNSENVEHKDFEYDRNDLLSGKSKKIHLSKDPIMLLIGEGDMSFTKAFLNEARSFNQRLHSTTCQINLISTELRSKQELLETGGEEFRSNVEEIAKLSQKIKELDHENRIIIIYGVDVRDLVEDWPSVFGDRRPYRVQCNFPWYYYDRQSEMYNDLTFTTGHMVLCVFRFASHILEPNGQLRIALNEAGNYYEKYELPNALSLYGDTLRFEERILMKKMYKDYVHMSSKRDARVASIDYCGYVYVYIKTN